MKYEGSGTFLITRPYIIIWTRIALYYSAAPQWYYFAKFLLLSLFFFFYDPLVIIIRAFRRRGELPCFPLPTPSSAVTSKFPTGGFYFMQDFNDRVTINLQDSPLHRGGFGVGHPDRSWRCHVLRIGHAEK